MFVILLRLDVTVALLSLAVVPFLYLCLRYYMRTLVDRDRAGEGARVEADRAALRGVLGDPARQELRARAARGQRYTSVGQQVDAARASPSPGRSRCSRSSSARSRSSARRWSLIVGGMHVLRGRMTLGELMVVHRLSGRGVRPAVGDRAHDRASCRARWPARRRVRAMFALMPETVDAPDADRRDAASRATSGSSDVGFAYPDGTHGAARHHFSAAARRDGRARRPHRRRQDDAGQPDSALLRATEGRVLIDGVDVRRVPACDRCARGSRSCCRTRCSSRARSPTTSATAGSTRPTRRSKQAARAAHAHEFISRLPKRLRHAELPRPAAGCRAASASG